MKEEKKRERASERSALNIYPRPENIIPPPERCEGLCPFQQPTRHRHSDSICMYVVVCTT